MTTCGILFDVQMVLLVKERIPIVLLLMCPHNWPYMSMSFGLQVKLIPSPFLSSPSLPPSFFHVYEHIHWVGSYPYCSPPLPHLSLFPSPRLPLHQVFALCDPEGRGYITRETLSKFCDRRNSVLDSIMSTLDHDKDGKISYDEFREGFEVLYPTHSQHEKQHFTCLHSFVLVGTCFG